MGNPVLLWKTWDYSHYMLMVSSWTTDLMDISITSPSSSSSSTECTKFMERCTQGTQLAQSRKTNIFIGFEVNIGRNTGVYSLWLCSNSKFWAKKTNRIVKNILSVSRPDDRNQPLLIVLQVSKLPYGWWKVQVRTWGCKFCMTY